MKKVLISSNLYLPNIGGAENSMFYLAQEYAKKGYVVDIVTSDMNNVSSDRLPAVEKVDEYITIYRYAADHRFIPRTFYMYKTAFKLYRWLISEKHYDVCFFRSHFNVITAWLAGVRNITFLLAGVVKNQRANERASLSSKLSTRLKRWLDNKYHHFMQKFALKLASNVMVFSKTMVEQLAEVFKVDRFIPIVKPGVDFNRYCSVSEQVKSDIRKDLNLPKSKVIMLGLGRFVQSKAYDQVIASLALLPEEFVLCLVGKGVEEEVYRSLIQKNGLTDRVFIYPSTVTPELYYQASDIFMMTSVYETLGQTTLEAQACGLPVVAFEPCKSVVTATKEITGQETSVFCEAFNAKALADAIIDVRDKIKTNNFTPAKIETYAHNKFSWKKLSDEIEGDK